MKECNGGSRLYPVGSSEFKVVGYTSPSCTGTVTLYYIGNAQSTRQTGSLTDLILKPPKQVSYYYARSAFISIHCFVELMCRYRKHHVQE